MKRGKTAICVNEKGICPDLSQGGIGGSERQTSRCRKIVGNKGVLKDEYKWNWNDGISGMVRSKKDQTEYVRK